MDGAMTVCARCLGAGWLSLGVVCHSCDGCGFYGRYLGCTCDEPCFVDTHRADLCDEGLVMRTCDLGAAAKAFVEGLWDRLEGTTPRPRHNARTVEANMGAPHTWRELYVRAAEAGFVVRLLVTEHAREWAVECRRRRKRRRAGQPREGVPPWVLIGGVRELLDVVEAVVGDELVGKTTIEDDTRRALHAAIGDAVGVVFDVWSSRAAHT